MGTTSLFVLLSVKPEYNTKVKMGIGLAPVAFWEKVTPSFNELVSILPVVKVTVRVCGFFLLQAVMLKIQD